MNSPEKLERRRRERGEAAPDGNVGAGTSEPAGNVGAGTSAPEGNVGAGSSTSPPPTHEPTHEPAPEPEVGIGTTAPLTK